MVIVLYEVFAEHSCVFEVVIHGALLVHGDRIIFIPAKLLKEACGIFFYRIKTPLADGLSFLSDSLVAPSEA
jgi:hypothetical protein